MPKGPRGEKRPADAIGCAVMVGQIATGEVADSRYEQPNRRQSGKAGAEARTQSLTPEQRKEIASAAAKARWDGKEATMNEKNRLMKTLFETPGRELVNIKFFRLDGMKAVSDETFCKRVNQVIFEIDAGLTNATEKFLGDTDKSVDVVELRKRLA